MDFSSKFHRLSSSAKSLKDNVTDSLKAGTFLRHIVDYYITSPPVGVRSKKQFDIKPHRRRKRAVQSYLPGGASVPSHMGILVPPGEYD